MKQRTKCGNLVLLLLLSLLFCLMMSCLCKIESYHAKAEELSESYKFEDNSIIVTMDESIGGINKSFTKSFFGDLDIVSIEDLTEVSDKNIENIDATNFHQILKLELQNHDKEYVLQAIEDVSKLDGVISVTPNYIGEFCATANDPSYYSQWGIFGTNGINVGEAWDINSGSNAVRVGIVDTGISQHEDLIGNLA